MSKKRGRCYEVATFNDGAPEPQNVSMPLARDEAEDHAKALVSQFKWRGWNKTVVVRTAKKQRPGGC